jgi:hypothetical protein
MRREVERFTAKVRVQYQSDSALVSIVSMTDTWLHVCKRAVTHFLGPKEAKLRCVCARLASSMLTGEDFEVWECGSASLSSLWHVHCGVCDRATVRCPRPCSSTTRAPY